MRKILVLALLALLAIVAFGTRSASAQEPQKEKTAVQKEARWHGTLVRINKDESTLQVRKGTTERTIHFSDSTRWTRGTKVVAMSDFKEGADVICIGKFDEKGAFQATRIDLRHD